ncbi:hypothetical protein KIH86_18845 [Paenibacillus sp. HN-1]|uniref:hypothetical protein n=1 Tax=Paenibacillus TaxID=44249 RepID=UPI001CA8FE3E|nr:MULTISPECIES: hypothetical protein [Paenibacillus]MBY9079346.1 hypothetical protein [Paenibacillus sp. CGMCC 1.18879]MBY9086266.1 hypothetical protein [Paenibacillus sinensis]
MINKTKLRICSMLITALIAVFTLAACSDPIQTNGSVANLAKNWSQSVQLPDEYLITYEAETDDGRLVEVSRGQDSEGTIYFRSGSEQMLFVPDGEGYLQFKADQDGNFIESDTNHYTKKFVNEATNDFMEYANRSAAAESGQAKFIGEKDILGRKTHVYEMTMKMPLFSQTYTFAIDTETGVCLEWQSAGKITDQEPSTKGSFESTAFKLQNVKLPIPESKGE